MIFALHGINPEPWTSPGMTTIRRGGKVVPQASKSGALVAYQEAVRQEILTTYKEVGIIDPGEHGLELNFWLWRNQPRYEGDKRKVQKNRVDATNMQKALEDALQGVVIGNDRDVRKITTEVMEQGPDVEPLIIIEVKQADPPSDRGLLLRALDRVRRRIASRRSDRDRDGFDPSTVF